ASRCVLSEGPAAVHVRMANRTVQITPGTGIASLVPHRFRGPPVDAILIDRPNRFLAVCRLLEKGREGPVVRAPGPDRGRSLGLRVRGGLGCSGLWPTPVAGEAGSSVGQEVLCEVKSVGAARAGIALFPDAPTARGLRHLALLSRLARSGRPAALVFCAQRRD